MPDLHDAVAELIRQQTLRIHYLADLLVDPTRGRTREVRHQLAAIARTQAARAYTVRAPCLLHQLHGAVYASTTGRGGRTVPGSRLPLTAAALDLWMEITTDVHGWAAALNVDRTPYRATPTVLPDHAVPPVGQLLRATAAAAITGHTDEIADRIAYRAHSWAATITAMLAGPDADTHIYPIRGQACDVCHATTAVEDRDGERYAVPAIQIRFLPLDDTDPDNRWAYRICIACGDNGWIDYTTETTGEAA